MKIYPPSVQNERARRITRLIEKPRMMTPEAAAVVVDAAMFGIGCLEGTVRARIELEKKERLNEGNHKSDSGPVQLQPQ
jgi:hypothetical protein